MGDSNIESISIDEESSPATPSIDILKSTKELPDITNSSTTSAPTVSNNESSKSETAAAEESKPANIETVFENTTKIDEKVSSFTGSIDVKTRTQQEINNTMESASSGRFNKLRDHSSNIFPAGIMGCKEEVTSEKMSPRRFLDSYEASKDNIGHIDSTPRKMQCLKQDPKRNPVTGAGVDSTDEIKPAGIRKQNSGNPVLGVGYEKGALGSSTRIPPGGHSHGLW